jgi:hypothetical protein
VTLTRTGLCYPTRYALPRTHAYGLGEDNERFVVRKSNSRTDSLRQLLRKHRLHDGVYLRVAKRLGVDPSYVSKVASGKVTSREIRRALLEELQRIKHM